MEKPETRRLAEEAGLPVAHKPDSQDICFIPHGDYHRFWRSRWAGSRSRGILFPGTGRFWAGTMGITHYTIGQRKGLGLSFGQPMYVTKIDPAANEVTLGPEGSQYAPGCWPRT